MNFATPPKFLAVICLLAATILCGQAQLVRVPNTTLASLPPTPPQFGYTVDNAFPSLTFDQPVCIAWPPQETNRLFVLEKTGAIVVITNLANPTRTVLLTLPVYSTGESGLLGLAFHPGYATNRQFYVFYSVYLTNSQGTGIFQTISRFRTTTTNQNVALPSSERVLIQQYDRLDNHNGGDLHFGPDGYLYASVGDEGAQYNGYSNAQDITNNFFSAILRIDVDKRAGNLPANPHPASSTNYYIPADNPFVGVTSFNGQTFGANKVRTEFFSIGYRNPWRFSIDPATGLIYVGDVGQDLYEEVDVISKGANCGWPYYEGLHAAPPLYPSQPTILGNPPPGLTFPIAEIPHSGAAQNYNGNSVIGGVVYRGNRITQLYGHYVFADNGDTTVWMLTPNGTNYAPYQAITSAAGPSAIGTDPRNGDILICQLYNGQIGRLDYTATQTGAPLPPTLADTKAFTDLTTLTPAAGIVNYDLNVPFWSDNAIKSRWFSVPNQNLTIGFNTNGNWSFPTGTVWIKHFDLQLTNGSIASTKRIETRFIIRNTNGVYGITYRWDSLTNATLVPEQGTDDVFTINDGGTLRTQVWHYPSRSECLACHSAAGGYGLGFNTPQLNRTLTYGTLTTNQISALSAAGYFTTPVTNDVHSLLALAAATNTAASLEFRARSFLAANCSQCHQPGGAAQRATWDARITTPTSAASLIKTVPANNLGDTNNFIIAPGSLTNSILLTRMATRDLGSLPSIQMPPLASNLTNAAATKLISDWISTMRPDGSTAYPHFNFFTRNGTNLILRGTNGPYGGNYFVLASTNLLLPAANWPVVLTNPFDPLGNFNFTNPMKPSQPKLFYLLQLP
ncbi:MAG TPA: PQQ-dependent sugar dehydrogenase [Verrucomicrobiae bacterium]|nr:PQQ-dependent sugar dehydrogenase [Verrucomicrobiae bacterium]